MSEFMNKSLSQKRKRERRELENYPCRKQKLQKC